jgi:hypothetical protein
MVIGVAAGEIDLPQLGKLLKRAIKWVKAMQERFC